jgi:hypothetical protein
MGRARLAEHAGRLTAEALLDQGALSILIGDAGVRAPRLASPVAHSHVCTLCIHRKFRGPRRPRSDKERSRLRGPALGHSGW